MRVQQLEDRLLAQRLRWQEQRDAAFVGGDAAVQRFQEAATANGIAVQCAPCAMG